MKVGKDPQLAPQRVEQVAAELDAVEHLEHEAQQHPQQQGRPPEAAVNACQALLRAGLVGAGGIGRSLDVHVTLRSR